MSTVCIHAKNNNKLVPPKSWDVPETHYIVAMTNPWYKLIFKIQSLISWNTFLFYKKINIHSAMLPITTGAISSPMGLGSDSKPVQVHIDNNPTFLADSMQFMLEYLLRFEKNGVFYIMPSFRGEITDYRHLAEFHHSEAEICGDLGDIINLVEKYIKHLCKVILDNCAEELIINGFSLEHMQKLLRNKKPIPRIRFEDALKELQYDSKFIRQHESNFSIITSEGEQQLMKLFAGPVWLTHHPQLAVPFYQSNEDGTNFSNSADLLMGIGETVGAGERHETSEQLINAMQQRAINVKPYDWYIKMKELSPLKTSGFGMGIERFILWILQHHDIRDCQIVPRFNGICFKV